MNIRYSIIIAYYQQKAQLKECLKALGQQDHDLSDTEIIIVTHDLGIEDFLQAEKIELNIVLNEDQPNPYTSRNLGMRSASGEYYCFLDCSCVPQPNWLSTIANYLIASTAKIAVGRFHVTPAGFKVTDLAHPVLYLNNQKNVDRGYGVPAGQLIFHRSVIEDIGMFDDLKISGSDIALTKEALMRGYEIHYIHNAVVDYRGHTYDDLKDKMRKYATGVVHHEAIGLSDQIRGWFPMRLSLFYQNLQYRGLESVSWIKKTKLWVLIWRLKIYYSLKVIQAQRARYSGASRDKE